MTAPTIAPTPPLYPATVHPSRVPPPATAADDATVDAVGDRRTESAAAGTVRGAAYLVASKLSSPRVHSTPTLPPGVSFVEEPSGIKIYVGSEQVSSAAPKGPVGANVGR